MPINIHDANVRIRKATIERMVSIVIFFKSWLPIIEPNAPEMTENSPITKYSLISTFNKFVEYTPILVKSTKVDMTTVVDIKTFLFKSIFIKKALRNAPWFPVSPPKKPLKKPPIGRVFLSNFRFFKKGNRSNKENIINKTETKNFMIVTFLCSPNKKIE